MASKIVEFIAENGIYYLVPNGYWIEGDVQYIVR
jgi:hypothetical protein